jgi:hypothetical protein
MPLSSNQLAALVARSREKAPPVVAPPSPAVSRRKVPDKPAQPPQPVAKAIPAQPSPAKPAEPPTHPTPAPPPETSPDDFPIGWEWKKDSWHFHRRFYAIFKRPMRRGEYSYLLHQIRGGHAEHVCEDCWRVRLPGNGDRTLPVRATPWRLITILPKQPPVPALQQPAIDQ